MNWKETRLGKATASKVSLLLGKDDNKFTQGGETYLMEIVAERLTGQGADEVFSKPIEWGNNYEPIAYAEFIKKYSPAASIYFGKENPQFFSLFEMEGFAGGSPDFTTTLNDHSVVIGEIKCPYNSAVHCVNALIETQEQLKKEHPDYYAQLQMNMMCANATLGLFVSFDPRNLFTPLVVIEVLPDEELQNKIKTKLNLAKDFVLDRVQKIKNK
jgi:hypothetical protein